MNIFVLGPHRSGTSLIARLVNLCGFTIGDPDELLPPSEDIDPADPFFENISNPFMPQGERNPFLP